MLKTITSFVDSLGSLTYKGLWNAATNTPTLASGVGTTGDYYVVSVGGTTTLDGISSWTAGDWAIFNGSVWEKYNNPADTLGEVLANGNTTAGTDISVTTGDDITFADNSKAIFGAGDLQIYHDGNNSLIKDDGTGDLRLRTDNKVVLEGSSGEDYAVFNDNGAVQLYFDSGTYPAAKLATTATGIDVTGSITATVTGNEDVLTLISTDADENSGPRLSLTRNSASPADNDYVGLIAFNGQNSADESIRMGMIRTQVLDVTDGTEDSTLTFYSRHGGTETQRLATTATGIDVTGSVTADGLDVSTGVYSINTSGASLISSTGSVKIDIDSDNNANDNRFLITSDGNTKDRLEVKENGDISFYEDTGTTPKFFWDASAESLGIGTTTPDTALELSRLNNTGNTGVPTLRFTDTDTSSAAGQKSGQIEFKTSDATPGPAGVHSFINGQTEGTSGLGALVFGTGQSGSASEAMRIDANGNLLVGTTDTTIYNNSANNATDNGMVYSAVDSRLDVTRYTTNSVAAVASFNRTGNDGSILSFAKSGVSVGSIGAQGGDLVIYSTTAGHEGLRLGNGAIVATDNAGTTTDSECHLGGASSRFTNLYLSTNIHQGATTPSSSEAGVLTEAVGRATYSRGSGIGGFSHLKFINGNGTVGTVTTSGSATAYNTSSDYRLKEKIVSISGATERLKQLKPSRFNFIADADTTVDGFLAHEVQDIVPEAITGTKDAMMDEEYEVTPAVLDDDGNVVTEAVMGTRSVPNYQGIDQSKLVPLLVATIQELEARIATLEGNPPQETTTTERVII